MGCEADVQLFAATAPIVRGSDAAQRGVPDYFGLMAILLLSSCETFGVAIRTSLPPERLQGRHWSGIRYPEGRLLVAVTSVLGPSRSDFTSRETCFHALSGR